MTIEQEFQTQVVISQWVDDNFKIKLPSDNKSLIAIGCFDITIEHHAAICLLFKSGMYGSMFALLRSIYEGYVRGQFIKYCATVLEIEMFKKDTLDITFKELVNRIEQSIDLSGSSLSTLHKTSWKKFNSFTHAGFQHITRKHKNGITGAVNYPENELIQGLRISGSFSLLAAGELAVLAEDQELVNATLEKMREYSNNLIG